MKPICTPVRVSITQDEYDKLMGVLYDTPISAMPARASWQPETVEIPEAEYRYLTRMVSEITAPEVFDQSDITTDNRPAERRPCVLRKLTGASRRAREVAEPLSVWEEAISRAFERVAVE
jgi:hypothetical protein